MENQRPGGGRNDGGSGGNKENARGGQKPSGPPLQQTTNRADPSRLSTAMSSLTVDGLRKPTNEESRYYFVGLGGGKLIVRTDGISRPWQGYPTESGWAGRIHPVVKRYVALGVHPSQDLPIIFALRPLLPDIVSILESANAPWTWFTGIRIGYGSRTDQHNLDSKHPAVFLLNVEYGTTFEGIVNVTKIIKGLLDHHNVPIHVEVRENTLYDHGASSHKPEHRDILTLETVVQDNKYWMTTNNKERLARDLSTTVLPLLSTLGWQVAKSASKEDEYGTAGPFIRLDSSDELFALTCFHVLLPQTENPKSIKPGKPGPGVSQACSDTVGSILRHVRDTVKIMEDDSSTVNALAKVKAYDEWLKLRSGSKPEEPLQSERTAADVFKYGSAILTALDTIYDDMVPGKKEIVKGTGIKRRLIGQVYAAPEYQVCGANGVISDPKSRGFLNDWALMRLYKNKFRKPSNKVYLGQKGKDALTAAYDSAPKQTLKEQEVIMENIDTNNGFIHMNGQIASIQDDAPKQGKPGIPCTRVFKRGARTGLSFGVTNSIEACVRATRYRKHKGNDIPVASSCSWELLVIPVPNQTFQVNKDTGEPRCCFSARGDSGAAVMNASGVFIGQVVSGGSSGPSDNIYIKMNERTWRGQAEGSGDPGKPTLYERGKLPHEVKPEEPELEPFQANMDVTFVHMAGPLMTDIERWVEKKPTLLKP